MSMMSASGTGKKVGISEFESPRTPPRVPRQDGKPRANNFQRKKSSFSSGSLCNPAIVEAAISPEATSIGGGSGRGVRLDVCADDDADALAPSEADDEGTSSTMKQCAYISLCSFWACSVLTCESNHACRLGCRIQVLGFGNWGLV